MPTLKKIETKDFYKSLPSLDHETGDIWSGLPTFGIFEGTAISAVAITPACDLSQKKTETITFLPIIAIGEYLYCKSFLQEVWKEISQKLPAIGFGAIAPAHRFCNPPADEILKVIDFLEGNSQHADLYKRLKVYHSYIIYTNKKVMDRTGLARPNISEIIKGKRYDEILKKILTNSFKSDLHFLPAYGSSAEYSAIPEHSVALFRYAFSLPIEILDSAQGSSEAWWPQDRSVIAAELPAANHFGSWPIKLSTVKDDFLSDLLSRYLGMFIRLGARDFTEQSIDSFVKDLRGELICI